jgi:ABC-type taurine transport system ATPase subunit
MYGEDLIHWSTMVGSVQYTIDLDIRETLIVRAYCIEVIREARRSAPLNSSRGMVSDLSGATFDRVGMSRVQAWLPRLVVLR